MMLKLKEQEFKKLIKFNSNKVNVTFHSKKWHQPLFSSGSWAAGAESTAASGESQGRPYNGQTPQSTRRSVCKWANKHSIWKEPLLFGPTQGDSVLLTSAAHRLRRIATT